MSRPQLAPGVEIVITSGQPPAVRAPDGEFLRLNASPEATAELLRLLGPATAATGGSSDRPARQEVERLLGAFTDAGYLDAPPSWPADRADVLVLGDERLTSPLTEFLSAEGARPRPATPRDVTALAGASASATSDVVAVVWCLDRPAPPGLWEDADRLPAQGIAWARCHREGWQAWIEPIAAAPGDVLAAHVAARRLAATPAHHELAAYWAGDSVGGPHPVTGTAAAATVAALVATDLARWARGERLPDRRRLRKVDLRDLQATEHCVLPVPRVAPIGPRRT
ncbi:hypothetical protein [Streptosporangium sp. NPDC049046]|uniref:hypothetical protein n=1 Tax=unclassified Streptosporangium TaxID=2632669 RepID=UPI0034365605